MAAAVLESASVNRVVPSPSPRPVAHPLEYDWRFTPETAAWLIERLVRETREDDTIGYLGAPVAFARAARELLRRQHVLLDRSARWEHPTSDRCRIIPVDLLRDPLPALEIDAALLDPPWYPEYHDAFLWAAASLLRTGGVALVSVPPLATRPGVGPERAEILRNAVQAGLLLENEHALALRYATPPFERAAFAAAGIHAVPEDWRRGDVLSLRKMAVDPVARPALPSKTPEWAFVEIDEVPLALRESNVGAETIGPSLFEPAVPGATLATVSRRDSARANAVLWSSRNRVYRSSAPAALSAVVRSFAVGAEAAPAVTRELGRPLGADEQESVATAANQLRDLIRTEREEHCLA